jgi:predicted transcriptional regulator
MKEYVVEIVAAYVRQHSISASELPALIQRVSQSLAGLGETAPAPPESLSRRFRSGEAWRTTRLPAWSVGGRGKC